MSCNKYFLLVLSTTITGMIGEMFPVVVSSMAITQRDTTSLVP